MISILPQPGVKSLGNHMTDINTNFTDINKMLDPNIGGFTGVPAAAINTAVQAIVKPMIYGTLAKMGNLIVDVTSPELDGSTVTAAAFTLSGLIYTLGAEPTVEVSLNGGAVVFATISGTESPWGFSRALTLVSGANTIDITVTNSVGTVITLNTINITLS